MAHETNHREQILDSAQVLMLSKGYPATRVDEICSAAGVTKGSFYHHFASKEALASTLIDHYLSGLLASLSAGPWLDRTEPTDRLLGFFDHVIKEVRGTLLKRGCLLGSFALDLSETHPDIRHAIEARFDRLVDTLEPMIRASLDQEGLGDRVDSGVLARQFVVVIQGGIVMAKAYGDHGRLGEGIECFRRMYEALIGR